jgi:hypothetical protein
VNEGLFRSHGKAYSEYSGACRGRVDHSGSPRLQECHEPSFSVIIVVLRIVAITKKLH